ncbi:MAG: extra-cytoplasmic solute receptor protein [Ramlibacter sp.]|nr:extra-cytoplasmic solute receptor protein [Ramlibacter sp.]
MAPSTRRTFIAGVAATAAQAVLAQTGAGRHVAIVVGLAAGGGTDGIARVLQPRLQDALGQTVIVENKVGASGLIAAEYVAKAPPDGQTLMLVPSGVIVSSAVIRKKLPFALSDLAPVCLVCTFPMLLVVDARLPVKSLAELVAYIKANPSKANSSGSGPAFQLQAALFAQRIGAPIQFVQYKGTNESVTGVVTGDVLMTFADAGPAMGAIRGGRVRVLAVTSPQRVSDFPEAPTMRELGFTELEADYWMGLMAPARTPAPQLQRIESEVRRIMEMPDVKAGLATRQVEPHWSSGADFGERIRKDIARWNEVRTVAGIAQVD